MGKKYATLCSGIEGFGAGFEKVGLECVFQCEQDDNCLKLLSQKWPHVSRTSDVNDDRTAAELIRLRPDILAFGSPCQDLSVAGRRGGLAGERSGIFFRCVELAYLCEASVVVWENVPGVFSSNGGNDFAAVLEAFTGFAPSVPRGGWRDTGVCVGPLYSVAWSVLDAQWFGLAQRRKRVFLVASFGDRGSPYEILSLSESLPWDSPPSREAKPSIAGTIDAGAGVRRGAGINPGTIVNAAYGGNNTRGPIEVAACLNAKASASGRQDFESETFIAHTLRAEGHDASEDGTGRGTPIVPCAIRTAQGSANGHGFADDVTHTLDGANGQAVAFAFTERTRDGVPLCEAQEELAYAMTNPGGGGRSQCRMLMDQRMAVRRLTPRECERLQGFPDEWTEGFSDSARYRMLGNAVAVPVARWIAERIVAQCS